MCEPCRAKAATALTVQCADRGMTVHSRTFVMHGLSAVTSEYRLRTRIDLRVTIMLNERQAINEDMAISGVSCFSETRDRPHHRGSRF